MSGEYNFDFGMACEGDTDFPVIQNLIEGTYSQFDLEEEITELQPINLQEDHSTRGGDSRLLTYLTLKRFRDDVFVNRYVVVQVDTDVANEGRWQGIHLRCSAGKELSVENILSEVTRYLIDKIESGKKGFYREHSDKIIFAISVHSIECWLFNLRNTTKKDFGKIKKCEGALAEILRKDRRLSEMTKSDPKARGKFKMKKDKSDGGKRNYAILAEEFSTKKGRNIALVRKYDISLNGFISNLEALEYQPEEE